MTVKINNPVWGTTITYLYTYNPDQFEILGCSYSYGDPGKYHIKNLLMSQLQIKIYIKEFS